MLVRQPGFTLIAVLTLALGIGANTALFSVADKLLLRSLPVKDPSSLALVTGETVNPKFQNTIDSYPDCVDTARRMRSSAGCSPLRRSTPNSVRVNNLTS